MSLAFLFGGSTCKRCDTTYWTGSKKYCQDCYDRRKKKKRKKEINNINEARRMEAENKRVQQAEDEKKVTLPLLYIA